MMAAICVEAERAEDVTLDADFTNKTFGRIDQSIAMGALFTALPPRLQGDRRADRVGLDRAVDEPAQDPRADLRADLAARSASAGWRCTATCGRC